MNDPFVAFFICFPYFFLSNFYLRFALPARVSAILFVAVGCGVIPIVPRLQVSSSLDISIARTATSPMSILTSKHRLTFLTSLSRHVLAVTVPVKGLWEHFHTLLLAVRGLCFPLCWAWNPLSFHCCLTTHDVRKWVSFETHLRGY